MIVVATVLIALLAGAVAALVLDAAGTAPQASALDAERVEQWLITRAPARWRRALRHVDRRVFGGVGAAAALAVVLLVGSLVGWTLDTVDEADGFARWDRAAAEWGRDNAGPASTEVLRAVTHLGASGLLLPLMAVVAVAVDGRHRRWNALAYVAVIGGGVLVLNNGLKLLVDRDRPDLQQLVGHSGASFPSGHSAAAAACWAAIALVVTRRRRRALRALAITVAAAVTVAVAASRVLLGVHWLTDVVAGVLVGWGWFLVVSILFGGRLLRFGEPAERVARTTPAG